LWWRGGATGLDWSDKYRSIVDALAKVRAKTVYLDGELCGVGEDGLGHKQAEALL
jgi:bifunctional non-homologous end joining protein LigD